MIVGFPFQIPTISVLPAYRYLFDHKTCSCPQTSSTPRSVARIRSRLICLTSRRSFIISSHTSSPLKYLSAYSCTKVPRSVASLETLAASSSPTRSFHLISQVLSAVLPKIVVIEGYEPSGV